MSAWAAFGLLGLYPLAGTQTYILGVPAFANATISLPEAALSRQRSGGGSGSSGSGAAPLLTIVAHNFSAANIWAYCATVNGAPLPTPFVNHSQLVPPAFRESYGAGGAQSGEAPGVATAGPSLLEFWLTDQEQTWAAC